MGCCGSKRQRLEEEGSELGEPSVKGKKKEEKVEELDEEERELEEKYKITELKLEATTKREKIIQEILRTEQTYVQALFIFADLVLNPLIENWSNKAQKLTLTEIKNKVEAVYRVNFTLLELLEQKAKNATLFNTIGDVFKLLIPFLKLYSEYAVTYENNLAFISKLGMDASFLKFYKFLKEHYSKYIKSDFASYAITPIQRIPRYELLLKELMKETNETHSDHDFLSKSLQEINKVAVYVNQSISKSKNVNKLLEIINLFVTKVDLVDSHRYFIKEGLLLKICRKSEEKRMFFLFNDKLIYGRPIVPLNIGITRYILSFDFAIAELKVRDLNTSDNSFEISSAKKSFVVKAETPVEKSQWVEQLTKAIEEEKKKRLSFTMKSGSLEEQTESASFAPVFQTNASNCTICQQKFSAFKKVHHCKKCGKCVCHNCSKTKQVIVSIDPNLKQRICDVCIQN